MSVSCISSAVEKRGSKRRVSQPFDNVGHVQIVEYRIVRKGSPKGCHLGFPDVDYGAKHRPVRLALGVGNDMLAIGVEGPLRHDESLTYFISGWQTGLQTLIIRQCRDSRVM